MKKQKNNNGITLIALVVAIIVLLILAGVSIGMLTGQNGILTKATEAKEISQKTEIIECAKLDILQKQTKNLSGNITKAELKEVLEKYFNDVPNELPNDLNSLILETKEEYGNNNINIAEIWNSKFYDRVNSLKLGDKVNYVDKSGNTIECIVLYDSSSEYGIQVISANVVDTVTLGGDDFDSAKNSYNNALSTLYNKAQQYLNTEYAISARCVGSMPNDADRDTEEMLVSDIWWMEEYNNMLKVGDGNYNIDLTQMENIPNIINSNSDYWLASRFVYYSASEDFGLWKVRVSDNKRDREYLLSFAPGYEEGWERTNGFRPVFTLNPNLKLIEGDGVNLPYTLKL